MYFLSTGLNRLTETTGYLRLRDAVERLAQIKPPIYVIIGEARDSSRYLHSAQGIDSYHDVDLIACALDVPREVADRIIRDKQKR